RDQAGRVVEAVVPAPVLEGAARAQDLATRLRNTADYSIEATKVITAEALPPLKWVKPISEVIEDLQKLSETVRAGRYAELPEARGALLQKGEELYSAMVRTIEKLPPGKRRDAYAIVLGDLEVMIKTSRQAYDLSATAIRKGAPVAADGVRVVTQTVR